MVKNGEEWWRKVWNVEDWWGMMGSYGEWWRLVWNSGGWWNNVGSCKEWYSKVWNCVELLGMVENGNCCEIFTKFCSRLRFELPTGW